MILLNLNTSISSIIIFNIHFSGDNHNISYLYHPTIIFAKYNIFFFMRHFFERYSFSS